MRYLMVHGDVRHPRRWPAPLTGSVILFVGFGCGGAGDGNVTAPPRVAAVVLSPTALELYEGKTASITASVRDARGLTVAGQTVAWTVADTTVAVVSSSGEVAARRAGLTTVKATAGGVADSAPVTVRQVPVRRVVVAPATIALAPGERAAIGATLEDSAGNELSGRVVTYATSDAAVAIVGSDGVVTALAAGTAEVWATSEGVRGTAQVTVTRPPVTEPPAPAPVAVLTLAPSGATFTLGRQVQLAARAEDARGNVLADRAVTFSSLDRSIATVSETGLVTGLAVGTTSVIARSEGKTAFAKITVLEPTTGTWVRFESDRGDWVGQGRYYEYTAQNAVISVSAVGRQLAVRISSEVLWRGDIRLPASADRLEVGTYAGLTRYPFDDPGTGGMDWAGAARGCGQISGSVTIDSVFYAADALVGIDLSFVQHCERHEPALRGSLHWRSTDPPHATAGPVVPIPAGLWAPPASAVPASGNYVYLQSETGDWVGQGGTYLYTPPSALIEATEGNAYGDVGHATIWVVTEDASWYGDFQAMTGLPRLQAGYYPDVRRYPFHNIIKGGMGWSGLGRICNELSGWFVIDAVSYTDGKLTALDARFAQHCEHKAPALRGAIRWRR